MIIENGELFSRKNLERVKYYSFGIQTLRL